ncbi:MAG TPA: BON domain-containing protein [Thermoanaerobaculia bacterium]|nr:BON domain-containing protein [Thermoanaerobaculia bacterium]
MKPSRSFAFALALVIAAYAGAMAAPAAGAAAGAEHDATLAKELELQDLLLEKAGKSAVGVKVTVDGATAILTGEVPNRPAQELIEEVALSVPGIKKVDNRVKLSAAGAAALEGTKGEREFNDARLETKVKRALENEIGKRARDVEVEAVDGVVSLRGKLPDAARKQIALDTAAKVKGVKKVVDLITVGP